MDDIKEIQRKLRIHLPALRARYHVREIAVFGSHARGEQTSHSDIDILVTLSEPLGLEIVDLHDDLEQILGTEVDLVTKNAAMRTPLLWQSIQEDLVRVEA